MLRYLLGTERHWEATGHRSLGFIEKFRTEIDVWEMTLKTSYDGEGKGCVDATRSSPCLEVRNEESQRGHCKGRASQVKGEERGVA